MTRLNVWFPLSGDWTKTDDKVVKIIRKHKGRPGDSGAGCGVRDQVGEFRLKKEAMACKAELLALGVEGLEAEE